MGGPPSEYGYRPGFSLHEQVDAVRAYGCLLEFKERAYHGSQSFICDPEFIADRCLSQLDRLESQARERAARDAKEREEALTATGVDSTADGADEKAQEEQRRQEREREREERIAARDANLELGRRVAERVPPAQADQGHRAPAGTARIRPRRRTPGEVIGRDADGHEITRGEVVSPGEPLTEQAKRDFEETTGAVEWSVPAEKETDAA